MIKKICGHCGSKMIKGNTEIIHKRRTVRKVYSENCINCGNLVYGNDTAIGKIAGPK